MFKKNKKKIYIFLNNKIMSCDSILPLILEIKKKNSLIEMHFVSFDYKTFDFIKKNKLLFNIIDEIGSIVCLGRSKNSLYFRDRRLSKFHFYRLNIIPHLFLIFPFFIKVIYNLLFFNVIFIHFRALNLWPLKFLYLINKKNTIFSNADSSGWSNKAYEARRSVEEGMDTQFTGPIPCGEKVISFSKYWPFLKHPALKHSKKYIIESSHSRKVWLDYLKNNAANMLENEYGGNINKDYCVLVLGHIGYESPGAMFLRKIDSWTTLVENILDIIHDENPNLTIMIKPHIITNMALLTSILHKRKNIKTIITHLHPALLAVKAKFTIASHYSTVFQSVYYLGGITVEYTDQKDDYAKKLNNKGLRPEFTSYFFNNDEIGFRIFLKNINNGKIKVRLNGGTIDDPSGIINYFIK